MNATARPAVRRSLPGAVALFAMLLALPAAAEGAREFSFDADELTVVNMIGAVRVVRADGEYFRVEVAIQGRDAEEGILQFDAEEGRGARLEILFPIEKHDHYIYPALGPRSKTSFTYHNHGDHGGSWLKKVFAGIGGEKITVRDKGKGLEVWADITVAVPDGAELRVEDRVGSIEATGIRSDLDLDTGSGWIRVRDHEGEFLADTGSGSVEAADVRGRVWVDTGSGSVEVKDAVGEKVEIDTGSGGVKVAGLQADYVNIDTGSGGVEADGVRCERLVIDTGSGYVRARGIDSEDVVVDTGSGGVELQLVRLERGRFEVDTGSGSIELEVPTDASARISAETGSGGIRNDVSGAEILEKDRGELELTLGDGRARVILDASSGSIRIAEK